MPEQKKYCKYCDCPNPKRALPAIGTSRKNGKGTYKDWATRECHKKCLAAYQDDLLRIAYLKKIPVVYAN